MTKKITTLVALALGLSCSKITQAGGFKIGLQGNKQIGMGHTGIGFAQDAATLYFNPGGLSFVNSQVNFGTHLLIPSTSFLHTQSNTITNATAQVFTPFSFYANAKLSKRLNFGIGAYTPFGSGVMYPTDWIGRYILHKINLTNVFIQPTLSYRLNDKIAIGAGYVYSIGHVQLQRDLPLASNQGNTVANALLDGRASGSGYNVGLYIKPSERFNIGATYHSSVNMKVKNGKATFSDVPAALAGTFPEVNTFKTDLTLPSELGVGLSYRLTKELVACFDWNYTFWKSFDSLGFDYGINTSAVTDAKSPRLYENAMAFRVGVQLQASDAIQIRAGAFYDQTPVRDGYVAPELPDNDKIGLTCGMSAKLSPRVSIDLSLLYEDVKSRTQTNKETGLAGTFQTRVIAPGVSLNYKFGKTCCSSSSSCSK